MYCTFSQIDISAYRKPREQIVYLKLSIRSISYIRAPGTYGSPERQWCQINKQRISHAKAVTFEAM